VFKIIDLKQFIPSEFCLGCHSCCRFKDKESVWTPFRIELTPYKDYFVCPNLNLETNLCKVYSERPFDCRLYPFLLNSKLDKVFLSVHLNCPFIRENLNKKSFKDYVSYLKDSLLKIKDSLSHFIYDYPADEILELEVLDEIVGIRR